MNKRLQDMKVEIEPINEIQVEGNLEMKMLGTQMRTTDANLTNRIQEIE